MTDPMQIKSVCEEIQHLEKKWASADMSQRDLRAESTILRRLLVNDELQQVWTSLMGKIPFYLTGNIIDISDDSTLKNVDLYTCSEAKQPGMTISHVSVKLGPLDKESSVKTVQAKLKLGQYISSKCIIAEGVPISRNWLIQYVSNSLGGAHFGKSKKGPEFDLAMKKLAKFDVGNYPACLNELLAIGQTICDSESTSQLMSKYNEWVLENPNVRIS